MCVCVGGRGWGGGDILVSPCPDRACVRDFSKEIFRAAQPFVTKLGMMVEQGHYLVVMLTLMLMPKPYGACVCVCVVCVVCVCVCGVCVLCVCVCGVLVGLLFSEEREENG